MSERRVALVTGANRGIGLEICRRLGELGMTAIMTARDRERGAEGVQKLARAGVEVVFHPLDVTRDDTIDETVRFVDERFGRLDVLINNAGISLDNRQMIASTPIDVFQRTYETNVFGPIRLCQAFLPMMRRRDYGRIVNVSSGRGSFHKLVAGNASYRSSKTALNALTIILADELRETNILVNAMTPGWVRTQLGGIHAPRSVEQGAETAVWLATLPEDGPRGQFFRDRENFPW